MLTIDAILLGGGLGKRFAETSVSTYTGNPKQFEVIGGLPVFIHALRALLSLDCFRQIVLVFPKEHVSRAEDLLNTYQSTAPTSRTLVRLVPGGERRQDSSYLAIEAIDEITPSPARVLIHDACRPVLSKKLLERVKACLADRSYGAWVPIIPVNDTLKKVANDQVVETVDRSLVHRVQTPQIFEYTVIRSLVEKAREMKDQTFTDDASLCEYYGIPVGVFEGDVRNLKLTYGFEMETLKNLLRDREKEERSPEPCESESATTFTG